MYGTTLAAPHSNENIVYIFLFIPYIVEWIRIRYKTPMHMHKTHMQSSTIRCNHILIHSRIERHIALGIK